MTKRLKIYTAVLFGVFGLASLVNLASALEYTSSANIKFILNPTLTISTDGDMLMTVAPGNKVLSENYITVNTNNPTGYTLTADVGCTSGTDCYNNTSLSNGTSGFAIVSSTAALSPNTWGHTTDDSATTNSNFSPLPLHDTTPLVLNQTSDASGTAVSPYDGTDTTPFLVGAYASSTMLAGTYKNTVNFYAVANPMPYYMQEADFTILNELMPNVGDYATLLDKRDDNPYTVAKLADGKYWMTTNLDLAGGTALSADDTDVDANYISNFTTSKNLTKTGNTIVLPASSTTGFNTVNYSYVYNSGSTTCGSNSPCYSYYSWDAATLGSGRSISTNNTNAPHSICPKGWRLPTVYDGTDSTTDFRALVIAYGGSDAVQTYNSSTTPTGATIYSAIGPGTTPNFQLAGYYGGDGSHYDGGAVGHYWSATSYPSTSFARNFDFSNTRVYSADGSTRYLGESVRCLFK